MPPLALPAVLLACWLGAALLVEVLAWRAAKLGRRPAPPCFRDRPTGPPSGAAAEVAFLGDLQRGVADVALPLARALTERPAHLLVSSGDFVAHAEAPYYGTLLDAFHRAGIATPTRVVPGNHDLFARRVRDPARGYAHFRRAFGEPGWTVVVGPLLVAGIDDAVRAPDEEELRRLASALEDHGGPWIAVCHRPPRRVDLPDAPPDHDLAPLVAFLERRLPRLVVCGHQHARVERTVNAVTYVVNAHGGDVHGLALRRGPFELLRVSVASDGTTRTAITTHARRPWPRVYAHQLAVRAWWSRRGGAGRLLALPAALLLGALGLRAPFDDPRA